MGTDGKIHFVNSAGADTALNFNKGSSIIRGEFTTTTTLQTVTLGFKPKFLLVSTVGVSGGNICYEYDETYATDKVRYIRVDSGMAGARKVDDLGKEMVILSDGFQFKASASGYASKTAHYVASD